jgi:hypothetical protein
MGLCGKMPNEILAGVIGNDALIARIRMNLM